MSKKDIDSFFHMASHGNKEAFNCLYEEFVRLANNVVKGTIKKASNFRGFSGDFCDLIDDLFFLAINKHEPERGSFSAFANWLFDKRLKDAVLKEIVELQTYSKTYESDDEEVDEIEDYADPDSLPFTDQIALDDFKLKIASPNMHKSVPDRRRDKILTLFYAGYKRTEISKILKLPYSFVRHTIDDVLNDKDFNNIKLDLK